MNMVQQRGAHARSDREQMPRKDHEHVGKISTQTTLIVLVVIALILYEIRLILVPFVLAAILAYFRLSDRGISFRIDRRRAGHTNRAHDQNNVKVSLR